MKIVYVLPTLASMGGTKRIITSKANYMAERFGYDIAIICICQHDNESNFYSLSDKVKQVNLSINIFSQYLYKYPKRLWEKIWLERKLRQIITELVNGINPDIVIGIGHFKADLVCSLPIKAIKIIECHTTKYFMNSNVESRSILSRLYMFLNRYHYFRVIEKHADLVVVLTRGAMDVWASARRVVVIPNFSPITVKQFSPCQAKRIIAVGRLSEEKGFERLIDVWKCISVRYPEWNLVIFGEGELHDTLAYKIHYEHIQNVAMCGSTNNISEEYISSSICVVTSFYEGFSLVILEALEHGVPCVAFDCPYGPRSIIEDGKCGFLVEDGNTSLFVQKLSSLMENELLRRQFSRNAIERAKAFDTDAVMAMWKMLFDNLLLTR